MNKFEIFFPRDCGGFTDLLVHMKGTRRSKFETLRACVHQHQYQNIVGIRLSSQENVCLFYWRFSDNFS